MKNAEQKERKVARIFEDIGGYFICDDELDYLDTRGAPRKTKRRALTDAANNGYTHATGSGTYWGNAVRSIGGFADEGRTV